MQLLNCTSVLDEYTLAHGPEVPLESALILLQDLKRWGGNGPLAHTRALSGGDVYLLDSVLGPVVVKRKREQQLKGLLARAGMREAQLRRSYRLGIDADAAGLYTPEALLYAECRNGLGLDTYVVNRFVDGVNPWSLLQDAAVADTMLGAIGQQLARWHAAGLRHRDLKGPNILYQMTARRVLFLDLAGVHEYHELPPLRVRAQDLGRLQSGAMSGGLTHEQWQLLLCSYLRELRARGHHVLDLQGFCDEIQRFVHNKLRRYRRLNRPVY